MPMPGDRDLFAATRTPLDRSSPPVVTSRSARRQPREPVSILAAAFLFNLGQGVLRPSMPLYLEQTFAANYRMVTLIPVVFGLGK